MLEDLCGSARRDQKRYSGESEVMRRLKGKGITPVPKKVTGNSGFSTNFNPLDISRLQPACFDDIKICLYDTNYLCVSST